MLKIFKKYSGFYGALILWFVLGNIFRPLASIALIFNYFIWFTKKKESFLIFSFCSTVVFADSELFMTQFARGTRNTGALMLGIVAITKVLSGKHKFDVRFLWAVPFGLLSLVSFYNAIPSIIPIGFAKLVNYLLFIFSLYHLFIPLLRKQGGKFVLYIWEAFNSIVWASLIFWFINPVAASMKNTTDPQGFFSNPNGFGLFCSFLTIMGITIYGLASPIYKKRMRYQMLILLAVIWLSSSRTSLGILLIFSFFLIFYQYGKRWIIWGFWGVIFPTVGYAIYFFFTHVNVKLLLFQLGLAQKFKVEGFDNAGGRFIAWAHAFNEFDKHPYIGQGFAYDEYYFLLHVEELLKEGHSGGTHNVFVSFLMNVGALGTFCFVIILLSLFFSIRGKGGRFAVPLLIVTLIAANFEALLLSPLSPTCTILFFLLAILHNYDFLKKNLHKVKL